MMLFTLVVACTAVQSPFGDERSFAWRVRENGKFGDYRRSYIRGHRHAGLDLKGGYGEAVFPICDGVVVDDLFAFPHRTIIVKHGNFYSSYKHIVGVPVTVGQKVTTETKLGRIFTRREHRRARFGGAPVHLHLEIRKRIDDGGAASFSAMTMKALRAYCYDPLTFLRRRSKR